MPTVPAADGFSPDARSRRPQRVRNSMYVRTTTIDDEREVEVRRPENRIGPRTGMSASTGILIASIVGGVFSSVFLERTRRNRKFVIPTAPMLITMPAMIWSTL